MALTLKRFYLAQTNSPESFSIFRALLDNSYPATGYALTPAMFSLSSFAAQPDGLSGVIFPFVLSGLGQLAGNAVIMDVDQTNGRLRVYYPTGGGPAAPAALADPVGATGAVAVTSSAATLPIVPGRGKEVAAGTDLTVLTAVLMAIGH